MLVHERRKAYKGVRMKIRVDPEKCQGHTLCAMRAPQLFELDEVDGHSTAVVDEVPADQEPDAQEAANSCPEQAITLS
jgi:ferredoxin